MYPGARKLKGNFIIPSTTEEILLRKIHNNKTKQITQLNKQKLGSLSSKNNHKLVPSVFSP